MNGNDVFEYSEKNFDRLTKQYIKKNLIDFASFMIEKNMPWDESGAEQYINHNYEDFMSYCADDLAENGNI